MKPHTNFESTPKAASQADSSRAELEISPGGGGLRNSEAVETSESRPVVSPAQRRQLGKAALLADQAAKSSEAANVENIEKVDPRERMRERVQHWSEEYTTVERQFARYAAATTTNTSSESYKISLLRYEEDAAFNWEQLEKSTLIARTKQAIGGIYDLAQLQKIGTFTVSPDKSIEAAVGDFYDERMSALESNILADQGISREERARRSGILQNTWSKVNAYLQATGDYETLHDGQDGYETYHRVRNTCHNDMIIQLNQLNDLARSYGLKPFTPRNFMTNDFEYSQSRDRGGYLNSRAEYDRETVLSYFRRVFGKDFQASMERIVPQSGRSKVAEFYANLR